LHSDEGKPCAGRRDLDGLRIARPIDIRVSASAQPGRESAASHHAAIAPPTEVGWSNGRQLVERGRDRLARGDEVGQQTLVASGVSLRRA